MDRIIKFCMSKKEHSANNWLSNLFPVKLNLNGIVVDSVEAGFQLLKYSDINEQKKFTGIDGATARKLGTENSSLKSYVGDTRWNQHKCWIMANLLYQKFGNPQLGGVYKELHDKLMATGDSYFLEDIGAVDFWGGYEKDGVVFGENMTGKILMMIRDYIRELEGKKKPWNILEENRAKYIVNANNCLGVEGKGLALAIKNSKKYDAQRDIYREYCQSGKLKGGDILKTDGIIFAMTKEDWRNPSKLEYICKIARAIRVNCQGDIAIPKLGCGRNTGGLKWLDVFPYILNDLAGYQGKIILDGVQLYPIVPIKCFTSYFGNRKLDISKCVSIAVKTPVNFNIDEVSELAPDWNTMIEPLKKGIITIEEYTARYLAQLNRLDVDKIAAKVENKIMLCYENPGDFCHRHIVADWLTSHGYLCAEF